MGESVATCGNGCWIDARGTGVIARECPVHGDNSAYHQAHMMSAPNNPLLTREWADASIAAAIKSSSKAILDNSTNAPTTERKHISDAAWQATMASKYAARHAHLRDAHEAANAEIGIVLLTVAEHDELLQAVWRLDGDKLMLESERDSLQAEVERLEQRFRRITFTTNDDGDLVLISEQDEDGQILRVMWERNERLRKGVMPNAVTVRSDENLHARTGADLCSDHAVAGAASAKTREHVMTTVEQQALSRALLRSVTIIDSGHRLGTQLPDGDPVGPMSGRKAYRWGHL